MVRLPSRALVCASFVHSAFVCTAFVCTALGVASRVDAQAPPTADAPAAPQSPPAASTPENAQAAQEARRYFTEGMAHYQARRFREAIHAFELAAERVPSADLWFNVARAHEQLGEPSRATDFYRRYLRAESERAARRSRPTTGTLRIDASIPGAEVEVDTRSVGRTPVLEPLALAPGAHRLLIRRAGYLPFRSEVRVEAGVTTSAYADLQRATAYRALRGTPVWAWVVGGVGVASLATSLGFGIVASGQQGDGDLAGARRSALASDVFLGSGLALALGATLLYVSRGARWARSGPPPGAARHRRPSSPRRPGLRSSPPLCRRARRPVLSGERAGRSTVSRARNQRKSPDHVRSAEGARPVAAQGGLRGADRRARLRVGAPFGERDGLTEHGAHDSGHARFECHEIVPPLEHEPDASVARALRLRDERGRERAVRLGIERHPTERVAAVRVEPRGDERDVGAKAVEQRDDHPAEGLAVDLRPASGGQREVRREARARAEAHLGG